jgi:hypothetical protein
MMDVKERMSIMNGFRVARKYIEQLSNEDLHALWELAKDDNDYDAVVVTYLMECEMEERKERLMKDITKAIRDLGVRGYVSTKTIDHDRCAVYLDGEYFGIWDSCRKTFVD